MEKKYDVIVIGSGGAGMLAAIRARANGNSVLLLEKLDSLGAKLRATGGGKCNLTNTLSQSDFMASFGRNGKFMIDALKEFSQKDLLEFFERIGVETDSKDGFRIFPKSHSSATIIEGLQKELNRVGVEIKLNTKVEKILFDGEKITGPLKPFEVNIKSPTAFNFFAFFKSILTIAFAIVSALQFSTQVSLV